MDLDEGADQRRDRLRDEHVAALRYWADVATDDRLRGDPDGMERHMDLSMAHFRAAKALGA